MRSHVHSGKDEDKKKKSYKNGQLSLSYGREQLETATKRVETKTQKE